MGKARRRAAAGLAATMFLAVMAFPAVVGATISGGCTATGTATSSGSIDLTTETVWNVQSTDTLSATGSSPNVMRSATVSAYALGLAIPIRSESGNGDTQGSIDGISMAMFSSLGKVFVIAGNASGDGACDGQILVVIDDVDALFTILGGGGLVVAILGVAAVLMASRSNGCAAKVLAMIFGALGAIGLSLSLEQFQIISPTSPVGVAIVVVGALVGFMLAGRFGPGGETPPGPRVAAAATPPAPAPAPAAAPPPPLPPPPLAPPTPPEPRGPGAVIDDAVKTAGDVLGADEPPPAAPAGEGPSDGPQNDGKSHPADDYGPDQRPVGGGGPM